MQQQLSKLGLEATRIPGVYGKDLSHEALRQCYSGKKALRRHSMHLVPAHIGCSASHLLVYREIVHRKFPCALILEDDVILSEKVLDVLFAVENMMNPERPEVLLLSPAKGDFSEQTRVRFSGEYRIGPYMGGYLASSYAVTNLAAQSLLKELNPVGDVADCWPRLKRFKVVDIFVFDPPVIEQDQDVFGSSTNAAYQPFPNLFAKIIYKLRRLRCVAFDSVAAPWRRRFHPYNGVLK